MDPLGPDISVLSMGEDDSILQYLGDLIVTSSSDSKAEPAADELTLTVAAADNISRAMQHLDNEYTFFPIK